MNQPVFKKRPAGLPMVCALLFLCAIPAAWGASDDDVGRLFTTLNGSLIAFLSQVKIPLYIAEGLSGAYAYFKTKNVFALMSITALALFLNAMIAYIGA